MAFEIVWHPSANVDFGETIEYVCQKIGWVASKKLFDEVIERMEALSVFPNLGVQYEGVTYHGNKVRIINICQNAVIYTVDEKQITIIVFWNNRQNPDRLAKLINSR